MLKEIVSNSTNEDAIKDFQKNIDAINKMTDKMVKEKDTKGLEIMSKELDKILKQSYKGK